MVLLPGPPGQFSHGTRSWLLTSLLQVARPESTAVILHSKARSQGWEEKRMKKRWVKRAAKEGKKRGWAKGGEGGEEKMAEAERMARQIGREKNQTRAHVLLVEAYGSSSRRGEASGGSP